jgi:uncharacterized membrane protein YozB (DUF420 family)
VTRQEFAVLNASLNGTCVALLIAAYVLILRRKYAAHGWTIGVAIVVSTAFLTSYLTSKLVHGEVTTGIPPGGFRTFYLFVLIPHVILAVVQLPLIASAVVLAARRRWTAHRKIARPTFFIWMYVSVTGVLIYFILYRWYPAMYPAEFGRSELVDTRSSK